MSAGIKQNIILVFSTSCLFFSNFCHAYCLNERTPVSSSIVFAIDVSDSISAAEMKIQMNGLENAISSPVVQDKLLNCGCTELSVVFWSSKATVAWAPRKVMSLNDLNDLKTFFGAEAQRGKTQWQRYGLEDLTRVDEAMEASLSLMRASRAPRKTILISGDGVNSDLSSTVLKRIEKLRGQAVFQKIKVSAVAIGPDQDSKQSSREFLPSFSESQEERDRLLLFDGVEDFYREAVVTDDGEVYNAETFLDYEASVSESLKELSCMPMM